MQTSTDTHKNPVHYICNAGLAEARARLEGFMLTYICSDEFETDEETTRLCLLKTCNHVLTWLANADYQSQLPSLDPNEAIAMMQKFIGIWAIDKDTPCLDISERESFISAYTVFNTFFALWIAKMQAPEA